MAAITGQRTSKATNAKLPKNYYTYIMDIPNNVLVLPTGYIGFFKPYK